MKIAIQGETGSFHEEAARKYFSYDEIEVVPCASFDLTLKSVVDGDADFAVMAIENARSGSILYNYTLIRESGMKILGEQNLRIRQNLMALKGQKIDEINEIRSHPIALAQCMSFLNEHPGITLIETEDTAASARIISQKQLKNVAAIAPLRAAEIYDLDVLAEGIETYKQNYTRFLVVGREDKGNKAGNKVSICFCTGHRPGSLAAVLVILANLNINLSKIQSVPRLNGEWEYMFYCDLELDKHTKSEIIHRILEHHTSNLEILGVYFKGEMSYDN
ncbi:MAG TPA: prephenate dehydratase domain-containing protein [Bacteroidales bacterium]|nr:prephenate dehydratase domain-containing protein [Bacteroidales bacterium]